MPKISFKGEITDFHPTKNSTVKVTIETDLDEESAKLLWLIEKGLDIIITDNQITLAEVGSQ
jgi:hypothetical protein